MTLAYVGELTIGQELPGAASGLEAGANGINAALPDIQSRLDALAAFAPAPIDFAQQLILAQSIVTSIESGIALGLPAPDISAQIAAVTALINDLLAAVTAINANLDIIVALQGLFAAAGVHVYAYDGNVNGLGAALTTALSAGVPGGSGGTQHCNALALITTIGATWTAMSQVFKVTP